MSQALVAKHTRRGQGGPERAVSVRAAARSRPEGSLSVRAVLLAWGPVLAVAAGIFLLSSLPGGVLQLPPVKFLDKVAHLGIYFVLALLLLRALARTTSLAAGPRALLALALVAGFGVTDELHQAFVPGRKPDGMDVVADAAGALLACAVFWLASRWAGRARPARQPPQG